MGISLTETDLHELQYVLAEISDSLDTARKEFARQGEISLAEMFRDRRDKARKWSAVVQRATTGWQKGQLNIQAGSGLITWANIPVGIVTPAGAELFTTAEDCIGAGMSPLTMIMFAMALPAIRQAIRNTGLECIEEGVTVDAITPNKPPA